MTRAPVTAHPDIIYPATLPFVVLHLSCFAVIWTGVTLPALFLCFALYSIRLFAVTAGYHRYFSHRSYKTSRAGQFVLAVLAQSSTQRGVLWWAAIHRHHHLHSDTPQDVHSRRHHGFWYSHMGWIFAKENDKPDYSMVQDLARYPELVWLDRNPYLLPTMAVLLPCWLLGGWSGVIVGFGWSTTLLYHVTFAINSVGHAHGTQPYVTGDDSRNNFWFALLTFGEGWHNNHHAYQSSTRTGFRPGEIDIGFALLRLLARLRLVWDLREPPTAVVDNKVGPGRKVVEKVARELAAQIAACRSAREAGRVPSADEIEALARAALPDVPRQHLNGITTRAREILLADQGVQRLDVLLPTE